MKQVGPNYRRWFELAALVTAWFFVVSVAFGQGFFRVSPGPLNQGHAAYDISDGCPKCHESGEGVTNQKCLSCHGAVQHKGGLHGTFAGQACIKCHTEHKGRAYNIIDWKSVGGRDAFKHELTGFSLTEHHGQVACTQCHLRRLASGRNSFLGLSADCKSCHSGIHGLTQASLAQNCSICHRPGQSLKGQLLKTWQASHAEHARVNLKGKHSHVTCVKCHSGGKFGSRAHPRTCADCHVPSHPVPTELKYCANCHAEDGQFKGAKIDHADYGFALKGKHAKANCADCHRASAKSNAPGRTVSTACGSCHVATHPVTKATANCVACHPSGGSFKGAKIDHAKLGFPLLGHHEKQSCASCHKAKQKLKYTEGSCTSCHAHKKVHQGQYADGTCARCHLEAGKRKTNFSHDVDTRFPLTGFHGEEPLKRDCLRCHPGRVYRTGKIKCLDCHEDKHKGMLGSDCEKCHSPLLHFNAPRSKDFAHSKFLLEGKHKTIACVACHVGGNYQLGQRTCFDCHAKDDKHQGKLGKDCGRCHKAEPGAPKFDHETMTQFARTGGHRSAACAKCHQVKTEQTKPLTRSEWRKTPVSELDLTFPNRGKNCADCHFDPHRGNLGTDCAACHGTVNFARVHGGRAKSVRPKDHRGSWIRQHATLPEYDGAHGAEKRDCASCHGTPTCTHCHRTERPRSHTALWRIRTHGAAAAFDSSSCSTCHRAASCHQCHRRTRPLNHRGNWLKLHGFASGGFGESNCFVCHRRADCELCHRAK